MHLSIPGLAELESVPQIKRAIESGDRHKVYRRIWWSRLLGRFRPAQRKVADELLAHPERFYKKLKRAPTLQTMNGIGGLIYNGTPTEEEGLLRGTHFLVFVFLPILPLGSYLYAREGEAYHFAGKLPFTTVPFLWRSLIAATAGGLALVLGGLGLSHMRYAEVDIVNGLDEVVHLQLGSRSVSLEPGAHTQLQGVVRSLTEVQVSGEDGAHLETIPVDFNRGFDAYVLNPLGAGGVYRESIIYTVRDEDLRGKVDVFCGKSFLGTRADWRFVDPPESISSKSKASSTSRTLLHMDPTADCGEYLFYEGDFENALPILEYNADPKDAARIEMLYTAMSAVQSPETTKATFDALAQSDPTTPVLRYRAVHYASMGLEEEHQAQARAAHLADPQDAQALYMYLRGEDQDTVLDTLEQNTGALAEEPYLARLYVLNLTEARRYEEALEHNALLGDHPFLGAEAAYNSAALLLRLGREEQALSVLNSQAEVDPAAASALLRLDPTPRLDLTENWRAMLGNQGVSVAGGRPLSEPYSQVDQLTWQLRNAPLDALELALNTAPAQLRKLSPVDLLLLTHIAEHQGEEALRERCQNELKAATGGQELIDLLADFNASTEAIHDTPDPLFLTASLWDKGLNEETRALYRDTLARTDPFGMWDDAQPPE